MTREISFVRRATSIIEVALLVIATTACGTDFVTPDDDPQQVADGEVVYRENCMQCHGDSGEGSVKGPQILSPVIPYATFVTKTGRHDMGYVDAMPAYAGELADSEIASVLAWLSQPAKPTDGAGLYTRFCGNCHGVDAYGGRTGQDVTGEVDEVMEKVREGHGGSSYGNRTKYMPSWHDAELTDSEVALIRSYISSLPANPNGGDDDDDDDDGDHDD